MNVKAKRTKKQVKVQDSSINVLSMVTFHTLARRRGCMFFVQTAKNEKKSYPEAKRKSAKNVDKISVPIMIVGNCFFLFNSCLFSSVKF